MRRHRFVLPHPLFFGSAAFAGPAGYAAGPGTDPGGADPWTATYTSGYTSGPMGSRGRRRRGGFGFGPGGGWPHGRRARRGDVRAAVLALLDEQPRHGYEIIEELERRSGGAWRPSPGSVYPTLQLLEDEGLVTSQEVEGRRVFTLTDAGRAEVSSRRERAQGEPWDDVGASGGHDLREAAFQLGAAVMQVARAGTDDQAARTLAILDEARRKIYGILAEGG